MGFSTRFPHLRYEISSLQSYVRQGGMLEEHTRADDTRARENGLEMQGGGTQQQRRSWRHAKAVARGMLGRLRCYECLMSTKGTGRTT
ncbi:hypothetical protein Scep_012281 [Stephania cephalantha]|uniref:Uncharacterized protein n=1 Tax=Stephania cephalantha TaxID=152367 RepID=A0AAP0JGM1_9MAGN